LLGLISIIVEIVPQTIMFGRHTLRLAMLVYTLSLMLTRLRFLLRFRRLTVDPLAGVDGTAASLFGRRRLGVAGGDRS
jgi:hypothetical protein